MSIQQGKLTYRGTVYPWHCDHMGHMNVAWYVAKFDEASWNFFHDIGITHKYTLEQHKGTAAVQQNISYLGELGPGNVIDIFTHVTSFGEKKIVFSHEMTERATGRIVARAEMTVVHLDLKLRKSCKLSDASLSILASWASNDGK